MTRACWAVSRQVDTYRMFKEAKVLCRSAVLLPEKSWLPPQRALRRNPHTHVDLLLSPLLIDPIRGRHTANMEKCYSIPTQERCTCSCPQAADASPGAAPATAAV